MLRRLAFCSLVLGFACRQPPAPETPTDPPAVVADTLGNGQGPQALAVIGIARFRAALLTPPRRPPSAPARSTGIRLVKRLDGPISPKSIVHSGHGLFFAQNMKYHHTITVYDREFRLVKTIPDQLRLADYGHSRFHGLHRGSPVEAAFSHGGQTAWVSNFQMYGDGFSRPAIDRCSPRGNHEDSFLYRIDTTTLQIERVIRVGTVPKFLAVSPDDRLVLVSNWCSWDLSVVDVERNLEIRRLKLGRHPRGIAVDGESRFAYVAIMGSDKIARIRLHDFSVDFLERVGDSPRHLVLDPAGRYLYATLNGDGRIVKLDLNASGRVVARARTGKAPRSMTLSGDGAHLFVVNYDSHTFSKVRASDLKVLRTVPVDPRPIGITYDPETRRIWVACYSGSLLVFEDADDVPSAAAP